MIAAIEALGLEVVTSPAGRPIARVMDFMEKDGGETIVVGTSYTHLLSAAGLSEAVEAVSGGAYDYAYDDTCELGFFLVMNKQCIRDLASMPHNQIFTWPTLLADKRKGLNTGLENPNRALVRFLLGTGAFKHGLLPIRVDAADFDASGQVADFLHDTLVRLFGTKTMQRLNEATDGFSEDDLFKQILRQINFFGTMLPHIPENTGRFLEIGFGRYPILSALFTNVFEQGTANELMDLAPEDLNKSLRLMEALSQALGEYENVPLTVTASAHKTMQRLQLYAERLETLSKAPESYDFCFSKVVFEHVDNLEELSHCLFGLLRPGGTMAHWIDFNDATTRLDFAHLEYSKDEARKLSHSTNNLLLPDVVNCWTEVGFQVEVAEKRIVKRPGLRIHPDWAGYDEDDLFCHAALITAVKP